ncbi:HEAT repeat domain-containing protein [candidate division KSB1 bacterium]|nr:HEAT repeat domain-containing protein [bacterium]NUM65229.1 HEAT repeat domain-containing protein [candidate division KSB1 bacterium]
MSLPEHLHQLLLLYDSNELTPLQRQQVEELLQTDPEAQQELAALRALQRRLQATKPYEPEAATLQRLRRQLHRRLEAAPARARWRPRLVEFLLGSDRPLWRLGFAAAMLVLGLGLGRQFFTRTTVVTLPPAAGAAFTTEPVITGNSAIVPQLANVHRIHLDPATGEIEIAFSTVNNVILRGTMADPAIRQVLAHTMRAQEQAGLRLKAVRAIDEAAAQPAAAAQDEELTQALLQVLVHDANDGVRLKAIDALKNFAPTPEIKSALIQALLRDANPAVRIAALSALSRTPVEAPEASALEAAAAIDSNAFIRMEAKRLLQSLQAERL